MTFQDYAAKETAALFERLAARRSDECVLQLRAVRDALDLAAQALEAPPTTDAEISELACRLGDAFDTAESGIRQEARAALEATRVDLDAARAELEAERVTNADLASSLGNLQSESNEQRAALADVYGELDTVRGELETARTTAAILESSLEQTHQELDNLRVTLTNERDRAADAEEALAEARSRSSSPGSTRSARRIRISSSGSRQPKRRTIRLRGLAQRLRTWPQKKRTQGRSPNVNCRICAGTSTPRLRTSHISAEGSSRAPGRKAGSSPS
jgi:chromosome segregation ATPase